MKLMAEEDKKFSWGDVSAIAYGIALALYIAYRRMDNPLPWLALTIAIVILALATKDFILGLRRNKHGKRRFWSLAIPVFAFLCSVMLVLKALGWLEE